MTDQTTSPAGDDNFIRLTPEEWQAAARARLADLGLTYEELAAKAEARELDTAETKLWMLIRDTLSPETPGCYDHSASTGRIDRWCCSLNQGHSGAHWAAGMRWEESGGQPEPDAPPAPVSTGTPGPLTPAPPPGDGDPLDTAILAAAYAYCASKFDYTGPYIHEPARRGHMAADVRTTAADEAFRTAIAAAHRVLGAHHEAELAEQLDDARCRGWEVGYKAGMTLLPEHADIIRDSGRAEGREQAAQAIEAHHTSCDLVHEDWTYQNAARLARGSAPTPCPDVSIIATPPELAPTPDGEPPAEPGWTPKVAYRTALADVRQLLEALPVHAEGMTGPSGWNAAREAAINAVTVDSAASDLPVATELAAPAPAEPEDVHADCRAAMERADFEAGRHGYYEGRADGGQHEHLRVLDILRSLGEEAYPDPSPGNPAWHAGFVEALDTATKLVADPNAGRVTSGNEDDDEPPAPTGEPAAPTNPLHDPTSGVVNLGRRRLTPGLADFAPDMPGAKLPTGEPVPADPPALPEWLKIVERDDWHGIECVNHARVWQGVGRLYRADADVDATRHLAMHHAMQVSTDPGDGAS